MLVGVNLTFFPQHILGTVGIPRRYMDYADSMQDLNTLSSFGSIIRLASLHHFLFIVYEGFLSRRCLIFWGVIRTEAE